MATPKQAFISADQIACSWLINRSKSIHSYYKIIKLCADGVQELALTSLPMIRHTLLYKPHGQTWFELPADYIEYCSVGLRQGEYWRPIGVDRQLMPYPRPNNDGQFNSEYSDAQFNTTGGWTNWLNPELAAGGNDFFSGDFSGSDFSEGNTPSVQNVGSGYWSVPYAVAGSGAVPFFWSEHFDIYGESTGRYFGLGDGYRPDSVVINKEKGIIMCPAGFPADELYLVYVTYGKVDTMTYIDVRAKATIDSYITWKYYANKRGRNSEASVGQNEFYYQHRLLRARLNDLGMDDVRRIIMSWYGQTQHIG